MLVLTLSTLLRIISYFFLRWLPGALFPKLVLAFYILYLSSLYHGGRKRQFTRQYQWLGSGGSRSANAFNIGINTILMLCVIDAAIGDWLLNDYQNLEFSKVGHVTQSSAKISIRSPTHDSFDLCYIQADVLDTPSSAKCIHIIVDDSIAKSDHVHTATLTHLSPATPYNYSVIYESDLAQHSIDSILARGSYSFTTAPNTRSRWSFLASSCIIPNFPYNPINRNYFEGWDLLYDIELKDQSAVKRPLWMIFLGDFIYYLPYYPRFSQANYFKKYRANYASNFKKVYAKLPFLHVYDDHDVINNYDGGEDSEPYPLANRAFEAYHGSANPDPLRHRQTWYSFDYGSVDFFMMDTRRHRSRNLQLDNEKKTMLGQEQLQDLLEWIAQDTGSSFKIMISSIPFTENWKGVDGHLDTWGGFLTERLQILEAVRLSNREIVVISGDRHEFASTAISNFDSQADGNAGRVVEFSISPLNQFYLPIPTYKSKTNDTALHYSPVGNIKWGLFTVDNTGELPTLEFALKIHGTTTWNYTLYGKAKSGSMQSSHRD